MAKNKILYIVATQYDNLGDFLINKCLIDAISNHGEVYLDLKNVPKEFGDLLLDGDNIYPLSSISKVSVKGKGLVVLPFTKALNFTHVFKSPGPFGGAKTLNEKLRYIIFYYLFYVFKMKGAKSYLIGNDLIIRSFFDEKIFKRFSKVLEGMYVRSKSNLAQFIKLKIPVEYSPDLCFLLKPEILKNGDDRNKIGISFRNLNDKALDKKIKESINILIEFNTNKNVSIEFFCQVGRDKNYTYSLFEPYKNLKNISFRDEVLSWQDRNYYNDFKMVMSNRLHVLLLAQTFNALPLGIIDQNHKTLKIQTVFESVGLGDLIVPFLSKEILMTYYNEYFIILQRVRNANDKQHFILKEILNSIL